MPLKTPDLTPAQLVAGIPIIATLLHVFGVYSLSPEQQGALTDAVQWGFVLLGADAVIRFGRAIRGKHVSDPVVDPAAIDREVAGDLGEPVPRNPRAAA